jgi:hypothetical protein
VNEKDERGKIKGRFMFKDIKKYKMSKIRAKLDRRSVYWRIAGRRKYPTAGLIYFCNAVDLDPQGSGISGQVTDPGQNWEVLISFDTVQ